MKLKCKVKITKVIKTYTGKVDFYKSLKESDEIEISQDLHFSARRNGIYTPKLELKCNENEFSNHARKVLNVLNNYFELKEI